MSNPRKIDKTDFGRFTTSKEKIEFLLQYSILAPSTHNTQPWLFKIKSSSCEIYLDSKYFLKYGDPKSRDIHISIGCAIENLYIASKYFGVFDRIEYKVPSINNLIAEFFFSNLNSSVTDNKYEALLTATKKRINARGFFDNTTIEQEVLNDIYNQVCKEYFVDTIELKYVRDRDKIEALAGLTAEGLKIAYKNRSFRREMYRWMHNNLTLKKDGLPGYSLRMSLLFSVILPYLVKYFDIGTVLSKINYRSFKTAQAVTVLLSENESKLVWVKIGRLAERLMLEFNMRGYNTSIFVASIEMGDNTGLIKQIVKTEKTPQFLFIVGKVDRIQKFTPRHHINDKLLTK